MVLEYEITKDLTGKVFMITGASTGIGKAAALALGKKGAHLVLLGRNKPKYDNLIAEIKDNGNDKVDFIECEFESLESVKAAANTFLGMGLLLHVLINNAGLAGTRTLTRDGFETTFGVNHLAHFLLTHLLIEKLKQSKPSRIVTISSMAHYNGQKYDFSQEIYQCTGITDALQSYNNSKLANVVHSKKLACLLKDSGVTTYSLHPGVVATDIWRSIPWPFRSIMKIGMISEEEGSYTMLYCSCDDSLENESGLYYDDCRLKEPASLAFDEAYGDELWNKSVELLKDFL